MSDIPNGWNLDRLDSLAQVERGKFSVRPRNDPRYYGGNIPFVQTGDIREANTYLETYSQTLNEEGLTVSRIFPPNTILITIAANIGEVALTTFEVACPDSLVGIQPYDEISPLWLLYMLELYQPRLDYIASQNAQKNINLGVLRPLKILTPPLSEQRAIADILGTWDEAIALTEALIAALQERKKGLMQVLLTGEVRFAEFDGEWEEFQISELGTTYNGLSGKSKDDFGQGKPYIPYKNIFNDGKIDVEWMDYVNVGEDENQNAVKYGDIFFTTSSETPNEVGMSSVLLDEIEEAYLNSFCFGFRLNDFEQLLPEFTRFLFRAPVFRREMYRLAQGSTRFNLSKREFLKIAIKLPTISEQSKISDVLNSIEDYLHILQEQTILLQQQKKGLMQQLLTGQVRVRV